jgi:hypothetical protein
MGWRLPSIDSLIAGAWCPLDRLLIPEVREYGKLVRHESLVKEAIVRVCREPRGFVTGVASVFAVIGAWFLLLGSLPMEVGNRLIDSGLLYVMCPLSIFVLPRLAVLRICRGQIRTEMRKQLLKFGVPLCPNCGYDCRSCPNGRCSECGTMLSGEGIET